MSLQTVLQKAKRRIGRMPLIRRTYDDIDLLLKYGTFRPERVPLAYSRHVIFVNPREQRGRAILRGYGSGQRALKTVWRKALERVRPTIALDVGANYGEFVFFTDYEPKTLVLAIEADPQLARYLERSREAHPHRDEIELVCALASEGPGEPMPFYVDKDWSGRSSALKQDRHKNTHVEMVPTTSVDALLGDRAQASDTLVFKIDVEGFEPRVLPGMEHTLSTVASATGILEFNTSFLRKLGVDPDAYLDKLRARFKVFMMEGNDPPIDLTGKRLADISSTDLVTDLVVSTDKGVLSAILP